MININLHLLSDILHQQIYFFLLLLNLLAFVAASHAAGFLYQQIITFIVFFLLVSFNVYLVFQSYPSFRDLPLELHKSI